MAKSKLPPEITTFVTPEGTGAFLATHPGQAQDSFNSGSLSYKATVVVPYAKQAELQPMIAALHAVEQHEMPGLPQEHSKIFGPGGTIRRIDETGYKAELKQAFDGNFILSFSKVISQASVLPKDCPPTIIDPQARMFWGTPYALHHPEIKAFYDQMVAAEAPKVRRAPNLSNPMDVAAIKAISDERVAKGLPPIPHDEYWKCLLPVAQNEIWSGCIIRVQARAYWARNRKPPQVGVSLESVLLVREGPKMTGGISPEDAYGDLIPRQELAPPGTMPMPGQAMPGMPGLPGYPPLPIPGVAAQAGYPPQAPMPGMPAYPPVPGYPMPQQYGQVPQPVIPQGYPGVPQIPQQGYVQGYGPQVHNLPRNPWEGMS